MNARSHHLKLHQIGRSSMLTAGPRGTGGPGTDEVRRGIGTRLHDTYNRSVLLSRAQVTQLHDWLGQWLTHGWDGVAPTHGPTSADVIEHYRDIAIRERIVADHARIDGYAAPKRPWRSSPPTSLPSTQICKPSATSRPEPGSTCNTTPTAANKPAAPSSPACTRSSRR